MSAVDERAQAAWKEYLVFCDYDNTDEQDFFMDGWRGGENVMSDIEQTVVEYVAAFRASEHHKDIYMSEPSESNLRRLNIWRDEVDRLFGVMCAFADEKEAE